VIKFHANGLMMVKDGKGKVHIIDPSEPLNEVARYIWRNPDLADHRMLDPDEFQDAEELIYVELTKEKFHRLRDLSQLVEDSFYTESGS